MSKEENLSQPKPSETEEPKGAADKLLLDGETSDWSTLTRDHRDCQTPSSIDHRIPTSQSCPATPRKTVQRKRKRSESSEPQFFETTRGEEVQVNRVSVSTFEGLATSLMRIAGINIRRRSRGSAKTLIVERMAMDGKADV
ncbi:hypothetical protein CRG98_014993 [Punica granatum]|uniref:Uncharacterized protein n=1 Tax=Punica granatum TaxID=22663 RepID=A0A2I0K7N2_PUNGR|nr:hypothetical protein CRG98_014993 [Punica granatum]